MVDEFNHTIHWVEQEFGIDIYEDYDYIKFLSKIEFLTWKANKIRENTPKNGKK